MSRTRQNIVSVVALTALGSVGVGAFQASQAEPAMGPSNIGQVSVDTTGIEDFAALNKTPRRLHQWMQTAGAEQVGQQTPKGGVGR